MKFKKSKLFTLALSVPVAAVMLANSAFAASSISTTVGGVSVSGDLDTYDYGASAETQCGYTQCTAYATAIYVYRHGNVNIERTSTDSARGMVAAYANADAEYVPAVFVSAEGEHEIFYFRGDEDFHWKGYTDL